MIAEPVDFNLRGAPAEWLLSVNNYRGKARVRETLICGPGGTGKSFGVLLAIYYIALSYPGIRILLCRHTRDSMSESTLVEWEKILEAFHEETHNQTRQHRSVYKLKNGSIAVCGGLNDPQRLYSTSFDVIYYEELTEENSSGPWEEFRRGARAFTGKMKEQLLVATCNPREQQHWLYQRSHGGPMEYLESKHQDNPKLHDGRRWTEQGEAYIEGLKMLTGVRRRRLYEGEWCAAEGMVWEEFTEETHVVDATITHLNGQVRVQPTWASEPIVMDWTMGGMDWGSSDPCSFGIWGVDMDRRMWLLAEIYRTNELPEWWVDRCVEFYREFKIRNVVVDPSRPEMIKAFNRRMAIERKDPLPGFAFGADNKRGSVNDFGGIEAVKSQMTLRSDGRPGMFFLRNALRFGEDQSLKIKHYPTRGVDEIPSYVYMEMQDGRPNRDKTDPKCRDHFCDQTRYTVQYVRTHDFANRPAPPKYKQGTCGDKYRVGGRELPWPSYN